MKALIIIDPQNDFCPGGALAVAGGDEIMPQINAMMGYIGRRKKRDKLVLGTVIGLCTGFLLWYSMS